MLARYTLFGLTGLFLLWALVAGARWAMSFQQSVILPNGMQLGREFDWNRYGRWDLFTTNGRTRLARDVEFVCFNDRYVFVHSKNREYTGLYDAEADNRVTVGYSQAMAISGLSDRNGCNGYYTSWIGPGLLYEGNTAPFLPRCASRNLDNETLRDRSWFERPCDSGPSSLNMGRRDARIPVPSQ
ncbi:MAG: hypothetical protein ACQEUZ_08820 [Pseudomonadota bacterium]